jgi:hypothetical protein
MRPVQNGFAPSVIPATQRRRPRRFDNLFASDCSGFGDADSPVSRRIREFFGSVPSDGGNSLRDSGAGCRAKFRVR